MNSSFPLTMEPLSGSPETFFERLKGLPYAFWLDSASPSSPTARWSYLGAEPFALLELREDRLRLTINGSTETVTGDPLDALSAFLGRFALPPRPGLSPFIGGAVGGFSYDLVRRWERLPSLASDDTRLPEMMWAFYPAIYAFDHRAQQMWVLSRADLEVLTHHGDTETRRTPVERREESVERKPFEPQRRKDYKEPLQVTQRPLSPGERGGRRPRGERSEGPVPGEGSPPYQGGAGEVPNWQGGVGECEAEGQSLGEGFQRERHFVEKPPLARTFTEEGYHAAVHQIKAYIAAGDIYQTNLTQRFARPFVGDPADLYLRLREVNPAPFAAYLNFGEVHVLSASPERFLVYDAHTRQVKTHPIKGTRPRSNDPEEDRRRAWELLDSEKDRAENLMIVDVHRNDLGRVCEIGSVTVPVLWGLESFATVHHLVSVVRGRLAAGKQPLDLVRAAFPAGSITGAPKLRAMEIIEEIEPVRRGLYTGSLGYIGWDGSMDLSVAIRTLVAQMGWIHYGVGGGIVADSDPVMEYQETLDKARGLEQALQR